MCFIGCLDDSLKPEKGEEAFLKNYATASTIPISDIERSKDTEGSQGRRLAVITGIINGESVALRVHLKNDKIVRID